MSSARVSQKSGILKNAGAQKRTREAPISLKNVVADRKRARLNNSNNNSSVSHHHGDDNNDNYGENSEDTYGVEAADMDRGKNLMLVEANCIGPESSLAGIFSRQGDGIKSIVPTLSLNRVNRTFSLSQDALGENPYLGKEVSVGIQRSSHFLFFAFPPRDYDGPDSFVLGEEGLEFDRHGPALVPLNGVGPLNLIGFKAGGDVRVINLEWNRVQAEQRMPVRILCRKRGQQLLAEAVWLMTQDTIKFILNGIMSSFLQTPMEDFTVRYRDTPISLATYMEDQIHMFGALNKHVDGFSKIVSKVDELRPNAGFDMIIADRSLFGFLKHAEKHGEFDFDDPMGIGTAKNGAKFYWTNNGDTKFLRQLGEYYFREGKPTGGSGTFCIIDYKNNGSRFTITPIDVMRKSGRFNPVTGLPYSMHTAAVAAGAQHYGQVNVYADVFTSLVDGVYRDARFMGQMDENDLDDDFKSRQAIELVEAFRRTHNFDIETIVTNVRTLYQTINDRSFDEEVRFCLELVRLGRFANSKEGLDYAVSRVYGSPGARGGERFFYGVDENMERQVKNALTNPNIHGKSRPNPPSLSQDLQFQQESNSSALFLPDHCTIIPPGYANYHGMEYLASLHGRGGPARDKPLYRDNTQAFETAFEYVKMMRSFIAFSRVLIGSSVFFNAKYASDVLHYPKDASCYDAAFIEQETTYPLFFQTLASGGFSKDAVVLTAQQPATRELDAILQTAVFKNLFETLYGPILVGSQVQLNANSVPVSNVLPTLREILFLLKDWEGSIQRDGSAGKLPDVITHGIFPRGTAQPPLYPTETVQLRSALTSNLSVLSKYVDLEVSNDDVIGGNNVRTNANSFKVFYENSLLRFEPGISLEILAQAVYIFLLISTFLERDIGSLDAMGKARYFAIGSFLRTQGISKILGSPLIAQGDAMSRLFNTLQRFDAFTNHLDPTKEFVLPADVSSHGGGADDESDSDFNEMTYKPDSSKRKTPQEWSPMKKEFEKLIRFTTDLVAKEMGKRDDSDDNFTSTFVGDILSEDAIIPNLKGKLNDYADRVATLTTTTTAGQRQPISFENASPLQFYATSLMVTASFALSIFQYMEEQRRRGTTVNPGILPADPTFHYVPGTVEAWRSFEAQQVRDRNRQRLWHEIPLSVSMNAMSAAVEAAGKNRAAGGSGGSGSYPQREGSFREKPMGGKDGPGYPNYPPQSVGIQNVPVYKKAVGAEAMRRFAADIHKFDDRHKEFIRMYEALDEKRLVKCWMNIESSSNTAILGPFTKSMVFVLATVEINLKVLEALWNAQISIPLTCWAIRPAMEIYTQSVVFTKKGVGETLTQEPIVMIGGEVPKQIVDISSNTLYATYIKSPNNVFVADSVKIDGLGPNGNDVTTLDKAKSNPGRGIYYGSLMYALGAANMTLPPVITADGKVPGHVRPGLNIIKTPPPDSKNPASTLYFKSAPFINLVGWGSGSNLLQNKYRVGMNKNGSMKMKKSNNSISCLERKPPATPFHFTRGYIEVPVDDSNVTQYVARRSEGHLGACATYNNILNGDPSVVIMDSTIYA